MRRLLLKWIAVVPVALALLVPVATLSAQDDHDHDQRYYDREHKDYHHWDAREDRAYHRFWEERHHAYIDWDHANARERQEYWNWRHRHPDDDRDRR